VNVSREAVASLSFVIFHPCPYVPGKQRQVTQCCCEVVQAMSGLLHGRQTQIPVPFMSWDESQEKRGEFWRNTFNNLKESDFYFRILFPTKLLIKYHGKIKTLKSPQKLICHNHFGCISILLKVPGE
jgi:hypothetical protein